MWARGELVCLNCSRFLGEVEGATGSLFHPARNPSRTPQAATIQCGKTALCCGHCGGRAFVEEWRVSDSPTERRAAA